MNQLRLVSGSVTPLSRGFSHCFLHQERAKAPRNTTDASHDVQNHRTELMSLTVTEQTVRDVKVHGIKDPI